MDIRPPPDLSPLDISALRRRHGLSQAVFARHLAVSASTVEKWECGAKRPRGMALRLLQVIDKHGLQILWP